jgi:hypothetical protein
LSSLSEEGRITDEEEELSPIYDLIINVLTQCILDKYLPIDVMMHLVEGVLEWMDATHQTRECL